MNKKQTKKAPAPIDLPSEGKNMENGQKTKTREFETFKHKGVVLLWIIVFIVVVIGAVMIARTELNSAREGEGKTKQDENEEFINAFKDTDGDGLSDAREKELGTNPERKDTDKDGYSDYEEVESGYNPLK